MNVLKNEKRGAPKVSAAERKKVIACLRSVADGLENGSMQSTGAAANLWIVCSIIERGMWDRLDEIEREEALSYGPEVR